VDGDGSNGHLADWVDDSRALLDFRQGLLQLHERRASWADHYTLLNVVELLLDCGSTQLELAGGHCGLGYVHQLLDHSRLCFYAGHGHISYPWHVMHSGDFGYCFYVS
jgi:hypothetical protein